MINEEETYPYMDEGGCFRWITVKNRKVKMYEGESLSVAFSRDNGDPRNIFEGYSSMPTLSLSREMYATVMHELRYNVSREAKMHFIIIKAIGDYVWIVENYGYDSYRIIKKSPIIAHDRYIDLESGSDNGR